MRIASLDDDVAHLDLTRRALRSVGHECHVFANSAALLNALQRETFDLLILDWNLPDTTGLDVVRWVRGNLKERVPILFVTVRSGERDIVEGLSAGADDFMSKPIHVGELLARVGALLRRTYPDAKPGVQTWGRYRFLPNRRLEIDGEPVVLTLREFDLALCLFQNMGRLLSRNHLLESMGRGSYPTGAEQVSRSLDTHISRVRSLLGLRPENGYRLMAIYGQGYRFEQICSSEELQP